MDKVSDVREYFRSALANEDFTVDRTGSKTIEMIGASFVADEDAIFGTPNQEYIDAEIEWYKTMSTNIADLAKIYGKSPTAWEYSANKHGEINSNYGKLIWSKEYSSQYANVLHELVVNNSTRRACMIYNRPSIWNEYNSNGKNDFICTNAVTYYIRDGELCCVVQMRSNDVVFGYRNDYAWQEYVQQMLVSDLCDRGVNVRQGQIIWQVANLHVYSRHFGLVK